MPRPTVAVSPRPSAKPRAVLDAALEVFLQRGYLATSMDEVAAAAGASKVTVYKHFSDKQTLFVAVVTSAIQETERATRDQVARLGTSQQIEEDLRAFARQHVVDVMQPQIIRLRRMIIAEASRFPELARAWHRAGPQQAHRALAEQITTLCDRGLLTAPDALLAAQHLNYLILSVPLNEAMVTGRDRPYSRRELLRFADEAVRVFLAAYRRDHHGRRADP